MAPRHLRLSIGVVVACIVVSFGATLLAQSNYGTWTANIAKSKYSPGPPPKSGSLKIDATGVTVDLAFDGGAQHWTYGGTYDGKDVPVAGNPNADMASRKRIDANTTETTFKKGGKVTSVNTAVVAADGKTMTITAKGTDAQGKPMLNVQVYDKK